MYVNPQLAYKAGYALVDLSESTEQNVVFRYVHDGGVGMLYIVPREAIDLEALITSAGHGDIHGALLADVEKAATSTRRLQ